VRPQPNPPLLKLFMQRRKTIREPGIFESNLQTAEAACQQLRVR
jgi:hypothetical protein